MDIGVLSFPSDARNPGFCRHVQVPKVPHFVRDDKSSRESLSICAVAANKACKNSGLWPSLVMKEDTRRRNLRTALAEDVAIAIPSELERSFRAHHGLVFRTAYRVTGNAADAEDVLQTVFLRMLRRGREADALDNEESYLRRAAINAALDVVRARQADRTVELVELSADPPQGSALELRQVLARAMAKLEPRRAEIFVLRFLEGLDNPEIAHLLGISQVLVAVLVHRTRRQLRKELRRYLGSYGGGKP
jgi:RNA polymerase sigma-70 factor, ECF subfamily